MRHLYYHENTRGHSLGDTIVILSDIAYHNEETTWHFGNYPAIEDEEISTVSRMWRIYKNSLPHLKFSCGTHQSNRGRGHYSNFGMNKNCKALKINYDHFSIGQPYFTYQFVNADPSRSVHSSLHEEIVEQQSKGLVGIEVGSDRNITLKDEIAKVGNAEFHLGINSGFGWVANACDTRFKLVGVDTEPGHCKRWIEGHARHPLFQNTGLVFKSQKG